MKLMPTVLRNVTAQGNVVHSSSNRYTLLSYVTKEINISIANISDHCEEC